MMAAEERGPNMDATKFESSDELTSMIDEEEGVDEEVLEVLEDVAAIGLEEEEVFLDSRICLSLFA